MRYAADMQSSRYVVLTRLGDSWILRAAHENQDSAEAEAFRWRRIYGPGRTRIAAWAGQATIAAEAIDEVAEPVPNLPAIIDVTPEPANDIAYSLHARGTTQEKNRPSRQRRRKTAGIPLGWGETLLRALMLYFAYSLANRLIDLAILMQAA